MKLRHALPALVVVATAGCDQGNLFVELTDSPLDDATALQIQIDGIELLRADGTSENFDFPTVKQQDMLRLQGGNVLQLVSGAFKEGEFTGLRLKVAAGHSAIDSFIVTDAKHPLFLPDANASELTVDDAPFSVIKQEDRHVVIDFDMRRSVLKPTTTPGEYTLLPYLRVVKVEESGEISGTVAPAVIAASPATCKPAIYAYAGKDRTPNDLGSATPPMNSARVDTATLTYRLTFMPAGDYTVAFTCGEQDDPAADEAPSFAGDQNATVVAGRTTTANF